MANGRKLALREHDLEKQVGGEFMPDCEKLLHNHDTLWKEASQMNNYAVFAGYVSMVIRGSGFLVVTWITVVLLGGFVSDLTTNDFWSLAFIILGQTAGIFDTSMGEKLKYLKKAATWFLFWVLRIYSAPRFQCAYVLEATVIIPYGMLFLPLAVLYMFGIFISGGISFWNLSRKGKDYEKQNLELAMRILYSFLFLQSMIFTFRLAVSMGRRFFTERAYADFCDVSEVRILEKYLIETSRGCEKDISFVKGRNLITSAVDKIGFGSPADCIYGVKMLYMAICIAEKKQLVKEEEEDCCERRDIVRGQRMLMKHLVVSSSGGHVLQKLLETLNPRGAHDRESRKQAAKIVVHLACSISLEQFPMGIQHISSLIGTLEEYSIAQPYVRDCLYDEFEQHWILGVVTPQSQLGRGYKVLLLHGLRILRRLAADGNNCRVITDTPGLVSKVMAPVASDLLHNTTLQHGEWSDIVDESMKVMAQMLLTASTLQVETSAKLRNEISSGKQAMISTLWRILINCNVCKEELKVGAIHILTRLYMDAKEETRSRDGFVPRKESSSSRDGFVSTKESSSSSSSRDGFVTKLVDIFTPADKYSSSMRAYAGEGPSLLCSRGVPVRIQEVHSLVKVLIRPDENKTCRQHAAEILEHICTHYTKGDAQYHAGISKAVTDAMPEVIVQIISSATNKQKHEKNVPQAVLLQPVSSATTLLASLFSLYETIYSTFVSDLDPHQFRVIRKMLISMDYQNKLKKIVKDHKHGTVQNLVLFKVISKMLIAMMKHSGNWFIEQEFKSLVKALSAASIKLQDLDHSLVFRSAASNSEFTSKLDGCTLASLVRQLDAMPLPHSLGSTQVLSARKMSSGKRKWKTKIKPKASSKARGNLPNGKFKKSFPKDKNNRAPTRGYIPGEPLLTEDELKNLSSPCQELHSHYLQAHQSQAGMNIFFELHHFHHSEGALQIPVDWLDLWHLYNLKELDASLMRCWTLHLIEKCRLGKIEVGFMDPLLMSGQSIKADAEVVKSYVVDALVAQRHKLCTLVAYNSVEACHWITILIIPSHKKVFYLDSKKPHDLTEVKSFIDKAWSDYIARDGKSLGSKNIDHHNLSHHDFDCARQPGSVECGYYTCHNMLLIVECILAGNYKIPEMLEGCDIEEIRSQLCDFLVTQVLHEDGMYHNKS